MADLENIANILALSVVASSARTAEQQLKELESQEGFALNLLHTVASTNLPLSTRLAGALFFKNFIKRRWIDENGNYLISANDVELVKKEVIPLMIQLPGNLQVQIGEAISVIAESDFPQRWSTLMDDLISKLSADDMVTNAGVLSVAHSICKRWRPLFRSDELFLEIQMVLDKFAVPFLAMLQTVDKQIDEYSSDKARLVILFDVLLLLVKLYYDLNCQDIPAFFEDNMSVGMSIMHKYLNYQNPLLEDDTEDEEASVLSKVKASIAELIQLYISRYQEEFDPMVDNFIQTTWNLLVSLTPQPKYDILVSKCMTFVTAVARVPKYFELFNTEPAMNSIIKEIVLPNVTLRESDEELFEDDPIEYIRRDLEGSDSDTRRRACTDFLKELKEKNESLVTNVVMIHIKTFFEEYNNNQILNWKHKDLCMYLFTSLAINGKVTNAGVTSTNVMLDVVEFFKSDVVPDLLNQQAHPILRVDAIKYVYVFRNQLSKEQLIEILPVMAKFLQDKEYVVYTYAAITIERVFSMRQSAISNQLVFSKSDIAGSSELLLTNLFSLILKQGITPEKLAENEFLMKAVHRVLLTTENSLGPFALTVLNQLMEILKIISKNPSNPIFTHYCFESIAVVIKYYHDSLSTLIDVIIPVFLSILGDDIQEFIPYVFQVMAYILELLPAGSMIPPSIKQINEALLAPAVWELGGVIPAATRLLKDFIKLEQSVYPDLVPVLGVFQRLISSKSYDVHGFELLEYIFTFIPAERLQPFLKQIAVLLLQRLQNSRTEKYLKKFVVFLGVISCKLGSDFVVQFIDEVQEGLFQQIWNNFVIETISKVGNLLDRKIVLAGSLNTVVSGNLFSSKYGNLIVPTLDIIVKTACSESIANVNSEFVDYDATEEISTFGSSYSRLSSITEKPYDPLPTVDVHKGLRKYIGEVLLEFNLKAGGNFLPQIQTQLSEEGKNALTKLCTT
ncbi:Cse1 [Kluyveromyces lactis]|nr:Cse1 [Kluyveromyces lactis]